MKHILRIINVISAVLCLVAGVSCQKPNAPSGKLEVFVSIVPQKYFVDKIGGDLVDAWVMVAPGSSPHSYEPRPSQMKQLSKAKAYFSMGVEFENVWLPKFANMNKSLRIVPCDASIIKIKADSAESGEMDQEKHQDHQGLDPHVWLAPQLARQIARNIYQGLCEVDSMHKNIFTQNYVALDKEISLVRDTLCMLFKCDSIGRAHKPFMVFHPSWAYFAKEFGLTMVAIEIDGKEPSPRQLEKVYGKARENSIHTIFVQPQFSRQSAQAIAHELKAQVLVADDLAYNWPQNVLSVARAIGAQ